MGDIPVATPVIMDRIIHTGTPIVSLTPQPNAAPKHLATHNIVAPNDDYSKSLPECHGLLQQFGIDNLFNSVSEEVYNEMRERKNTLDPQISFQNLNGLISIKLARVAIGGALSVTQTNTYTGLGIMSNMLVPQTKPDYDAEFEIETTIKHQIMAIPGAFRTMTEGVHAWQTAMKFNLEQYICSVQFLHSESNYFTDRNMMIASYRENVQKMYNAFRLCFIHQHARAAAAVPSYVSFCLHQTHKLRTLGTVSTAHAMQELLHSYVEFVGMFNSRPEVASSIIESAISNINGFRAEKSISPAEYFAATTTTVAEKIATCMARVTSTAQVYSYDTKVSTVVEGCTQAKMMVHWQKPIIEAAYSPSHVTGSSANIEPIGNLMPAVSLRNGDVIPILTFDTAPIYENGPSMGSPFINQRYTQWRFSTCGTPSHAVMELPPNSLSKNSSSSMIEPIQMTKCTTTYLMNHANEVISITMHELHSLVEKPALFAHRQIPLPSESVSDAYFGDGPMSEGQLYLKPGKEKLRCPTVMCEMSPRHHLRKLINDTVIYQPRTVMWNSTAMSSPETEFTAVASSLTAILNISVDVNEAVQFLKDCGDGATHDDIVTALTLKYSVTQHTLKQLLYGGANGNVHLRALDVAETAIDIPITIMQRHLVTMLRKVGNGTGHLYLTDIVGQANFCVAVDLLSADYDDTIVTLDQLRTLQLRRKQIGLVHGAIRSWKRTLNTTLICDVLPSSEKDFSTQVRDAFHLLHQGHAEYTIDGNTTFSPACTAEDLVMIWPWIAAGIYNTARGFTTKQAKDLNVSTRHIDTKPHGTWILGNNLPELHTAVTLVVDDNANVEHDFHPVVGADCKLYNCQMTAEDEDDTMPCNHIHLLSDVAKVRAEALRSKLSANPSVAMAMAMHFTQRLNSTNLRKFDRDYVSGWAYAIVRRAVGQAHSMSILPHKSFMMVLGQSAYNVVQHIGLEDQYTLQSLQKMAVVPYGSIFQGMVLPYVYIENLGGLGLSFFNDIPAKTPAIDVQRLSRVGGMVFDWCNSVTPVSNGVRDTIPDIIGMCGRIPFRHGRHMTEEDYLDNDLNVRATYNVDELITTCPFHRATNEVHQQLANSCSKLGLSELAQVLNGSVIRAVNAFECGMDPLFTQKPIDGDKALTERLSMGPAIPTPSADYVMVLEPSVVGSGQGSLLYTGVPVNTLAVRTEGPAFGFKHQLSKDPILQNMHPISITQDLSNLPLKPEPKRSRLQ